ncbi:hypothetical protein M8C21_005310, partial [Ambrosia artemisiifolia]
QTKYPFTNAENVCGLQTGIDAPLVPTMAAAPPLLGRAIPHLHLRLHTTLPAAVCLLIRRPSYTTTASDPPHPINNPPSTTTTYNDKQPSLLTTKRHPPKDSRWEHDPDYRKWKDKEAQIFLDIDPITLLIKDILHSDRYMDGQQLTPTDEKMVVQKLLAYHPHSEDKIGLIDIHSSEIQDACLL